LWPDSGSIDLCGRQHDRLQLMRKSLGSPEPQGAHVLSIAMMSALLGSVLTPYTCPSIACICARVALTGPPPSDTKETVFIGQAIAVLSDSAWVPTATWARDSAKVPYFQGRVILAVEEGWSGTPPDTVQAIIENTGPECPTRFVPGQRYLVFAEVEGSNYVIRPCTRTSDVTSDNAQRDLRALKRSRWHRP
jgi:hypothetical protein